MLVLASLRMRFLPMGDEQHSYARVSEIKILLFPSKRLIIDIHITSMNFTNFNTKISIPFLFP